MSYPDPNREVLQMRGTWLQTIGRVLLWYFMFAFSVCVLALLYAVVVGSPILETLWDVFMIYTALAAVIVIFAFAEKQ